jgi:hypothetical protein
MPAAVAAAAGTMVMGAPVADLPKTRMAAKGGATAKIEAAAPVTAPVAAAPAKKSPVMMIVAAVVVIGAIGGGALYMKGGGSAAPATTKADAPAPAPNVPADNPSTTPNAGAGKPQTSAAPQKDPVKPMSTGLKASPSGGDAPPVAPPAATNAAALIGKWGKTLASPDPVPTEADARAAIAALNPLMEKLSGADRSNAMYVEMNAYLVLDIDAQVCRTSNEVIANDPNTNHVKTATLAQAGRNCK